MRIGIVGGVGAMGASIGAVLHEAGHEVHLVDVNAEAVRHVCDHGLTVQRKDRQTVNLTIPATTEPQSVGECDLVIVFVKCYHTQGATRSAMPMVGPTTSVLSLQNGWGNGPAIAEIVGSEKLLVGVTYHSATLRGTAQVLHAGIGPTHIGSLQGHASEDAKRLASQLDCPLFPIACAENVLLEIWKKLCVNICTLPVSSLLRLENCRLIEHDGSLNLMRALLSEAVHVAKGHRIPIDFDERWEAITSLLARVGMSKSSMLQDVEARKRTEIEVINGAIVRLGRDLDLPTPTNQAMTWAVQALQESFT